MKIIPFAKEGRAMSKGGQGDFFAVGRDTFIAACGLGMNPAVSFLTMACGTGPAQKQTRWSATSVEKYTGLGWSRADDSIKMLMAHKIAKRTDDRKHKRKRQYELKVKGDPIWLPKAIITGVGDETPPVKKLRQTQDVMTLRLFVELYHAQNLRDDGGISRDVTYQRFDRVEHGGRGQYTVWAFDQGEAYVTWNTGVTKPHRREPTEAEKREGKNSGMDFFSRWETLERLGLVGFVPYLFEGEDGEPIHSLEDVDVNDAMQSAAYSLLSQGQVDADWYDYLIPVHNHMQAVQVYGVGRLRYRPHTKATKAWWAEQNRQRLHYLEHYRTIAGNNATAEVA